MKATISKHAMRNELIPELYGEMFEKFQAKLSSATYICLINVIWSNTNMVAKIGIGASIINSDFERETFIIGLTKMESPHTAENVKLGAEKIINKFRFNKSNITTNLTDQGSNMLKLHAPIDNPIEVNNTEIETEFPEAQLVLFDSDDDEDDSENIDDEEKEFDDAIQYSKEQQKIDSVAEYLRRNDFQSNEIGFLANGSGKEYNEFKWLNS